MYAIHRTNLRPISVARATVALVLASLVAFAGASSARAAGIVLVTTSLPTADVGSESVTVNPVLLALYVDPTGAAHVAWVAPGDQKIDLCTVLPRGSSCVDQSVLTTDANPANGGEISSIKYLPNDASGPAYLAVGIDQFNPPPAIDPDPFDPGVEEELFALGQSAGVATGVVTLVGDGDVILEPDATAVDVVGDTQTGTGCCYELESLTPGGQGSGVITLANPNTQNVIDVTKLPQGQTAVLIESSSAQGSDPVGMRVQVSQGGAFGPLMPLGISGPSAAVSSPGGSYVLNQETAKPTAIDGLDTYPIELYQFRGVSLVTVASVGAGNGDASTANWWSAPPVFEDAIGDLYTAWYTEPNFDGCTSPGVNNNECLMYRRIAAGGLLGPKIILARLGTLSQGTLGLETGLAAIAANSQGAGWMLTYGPAHPGGNNELEVVPLPSSAAAGTPTVKATAVAVPVSCGGSGGSSCPLTAVLVPPTSGAAPDPGWALAAAARSTVFAHVVLKLHAGSKTTLVLKLDRVGRTILASRHRLTAKLLITEVLAGAKAPTTIVSKELKFARRR
jgi:hypothetical protein